jgi:hypothetical protein
MKRAGRIEAVASTTHSVLHGTFIDPDYVAMPPGLTSNTSLFYWLDWPGTGASDMSARYCLFSGWPSKLSGAAPLSVANRQPRSWQSHAPGGDYMSGGFFHHKGLNYVAQWREPDGIHANIVRVTPPPTLPHP